MSSDAFKMFISEIDQERFGIKTARVVDMTADRLLCPGFLRQPCGKIINCTLQYI